MDAPFRYWKHSVHQDHLVLYLLFDLDESFWKPLPTAFVTFYTENQFSVARELTDASDDWSPDDDVPSDPQVPDRFDRMERLVRFELHRAGGAADPSVSRSFRSKGTTSDAAHL